MTKTELVTAMTTSAGGYFITKTQLARFMGFKRSETVGQYVEDLPATNLKYYFIPDVANRILADTKKATAPKSR